RVPPRVQDRSKLVHALNRGIPECPELPDLLRRGSAAREVERHFATADGRLRRRPAAAELVGELRYPWRLLDGPVQELDRLPDVSDRLRRQEIPRAAAVPLHLLQELPGGGAIADEEAGTGSALTEERLVHVV